MIIHTNSTCNVRTEEFYNPENSLPQFEKKKKLDASEYSMDFHLKT